jgi:hypothetical protein
MRLGRIAKRIEGWRRGSIRRGSCGQSLSERIEMPRYCLSRLKQRSTMHSNHDRSWLRGVQINFYSAAVDEWATLFEAFGMWRAIRLADVGVVVRTERSAEVALPVMDVNHHYKLAVQVGAEVIRPPMDAPDGRLRTHGSATPNAAKSGSRRSFSNIPWRKGAHETSSHFLGHQ